MSELISSNIATEEITNLIQKLLAEDDTLLSDTVVSATSCGSVAITHIPSKECWEIEITSQEPMK